ncbi:MAG: family 43 glycosylhydrolase [Prevotella sp.]|nr:family 43 glycosylhydrolase [Candidatus Prevotella equi]
MKKTLLTFALGIVANALSAQSNPIVQTWFTTDPAPMVHGDRLYIYTGHDEDHADFFWMQEWRVYSTTDMVNWTDHGSPLAIEDFSWGDDRAWAPQCIERNGKFYFYVPLHSKLSGTMAIGVAVGDSPVGPFKDAIGKPLADGSWDYIDPTVFIDDDGQAWLYWGNPKLYYVKLNKDMVSFEGEVQKMDMSGLKGYTEGPWIQKRGGKYYMMYAADGIPENIAYAMGDSPVGPWEYQGIIMKKDQQASFTNHSGLVDFKGHSYFFYHTGWLPGGGGFGRSVAVEEFKYNADGTIPELTPSRTGVAAVATFNPFRKVEAETISFSSGIKTQQHGKPQKGGSMGGNVYLSDIHNGDWVRVSNVDFGTTGTKSSIDMSVSCGSALRGGTIEVHTDSIKGEKIGEIAITNTGGWEKFKTFTAKQMKKPQGIHDMYFVFKGRKGPELFTFDWWKMK